jgi:Bacterial extracellular solute-binding protein
MTTTMTRFFSLGALAMVLVLNAWPVSATSPRAQAPVTIRVSTWDTGIAGLKPYQEASKAFEAANPGIKVDIESISNPMSPGLSFYTARVLTEIASGNAPDLILVPDDNARTFAHSGRLLDLGPVLKQGGVKLSNFYTKVWNIDNLGGTTIDLYPRSALCDPTRQSSRRIVIVANTVPHAPPPEFWPDRCADVMARPTCQGWSCGLAGVTSLPPSVRSGWTKGFGLSLCAGGA